MTSLIIHLLKSSMFLGDFRQGSENENQANENWNEDFRFKT